MTEYLRPKSLDQALAARRDHPSYTVLAGGTDLLVAANHKPMPEGVIDVFGLSGLCGITRGDDGVTVGAATSYRQILASEVARAELPALVAASREVGALQIQARGTLGGNIATSSPVGDTLPVLLALDARIVLRSATSTREVPYDQFCTGYRKTAMAGDELIAAVRFPTPTSGTVQFWRKMGTRRAQSISKVMVAASARLDGGTIAELRIGVGAVAVTPIRARAAETAALGQPASEATAEAARQALIGEIRPIDDVRSSASYRASAAGNVVRRFLLSLS